MKVARISFPENLQGFAEDLSINLVYRHSFAVVSDGRDLSVTVVPNGGSLDVFFTESKIKELQDLGLTVSTE